MVPLSLIFFFFAPGFLGEKKYDMGAQEVLQGPGNFHSGGGLLLGLVGLGIPGPFINSSFKCELWFLKGGCT